MTTTADGVFGHETDQSKPCSLREAILIANGSSGGETITFDIPTGDDGYDSARGVWVFHPASDLPPLTGSGTTIDATPPPAPRPADVPAIPGCQNPVVEIDGKGLGIGLDLKAGSITIRGLAIHSFGSAGVLIEGSFNTLQCNFLGTNTAQTEKLGNGAGVVVKKPSGGNKLGTAGKGNLISGNTREGILLDGQTARNSIESNLIGVKVDGLEALANGSSGIVLQQGASNNTIGSSTSSAASEWNKGKQVIAGNKQHGIRIVESDSNRIFGCAIGIGADGKSKVGNALDGISIAGSHTTTIGGSTSTLRNVIGANRTGIVLGSATRKSAKTTIAGNYIGTDYTGDNEAGNLHRGIHIMEGSWGNTVGGDDPADGNVIAGNGNAGILVDASLANTVINNLIGQGKTGAPLGNSMGVVLQNGAKQNWIGGPVAVANVIAYNAGDGVQVDGKTTQNNGLAVNTIHDNGGKGISLLNGAHGKPPELRIWQSTLLSSATSEYYLIGELNPVDFANPKHRVVVYSDDGGEGRYVADPLVATPSSSDPLRIGWFGVKAKRVGTAFTFTVSDGNGLNTSEFVSVTSKAAHAGKYHFDPDYWEVDQDNLVPLNPVYHGGWGVFPQWRAYKKFWKIHSWFTKQYIKCLDDSGWVDPNEVHDQARGFVCGYFLTYKKTAMFTGNLFWESYADAGTPGFQDQDNNFGLWTGSSAGIHVNSQRYYNPAESDVSKRIKCPEFTFSDGTRQECDAYEWPTSFDVASWIAKTKYYPLLTVEIDRDATFDHWPKHPFWSKLSNSGTDFNTLLDGKKTIAIGKWSMDGRHCCRSEIHPVYIFAVQQTAAPTSGAGQELWHFFGRREGDQEVCGGEWWTGQENWYLRFKGRSGTPTAKITDLYGNSAASQASLTGPDKNNDFVLHLYLPDQEDRLAGSVAITWK